MSSDGATSDENYCRRAHYLLVETGGPWRGTSWSEFVADAAALARAGNRVCLLLIQDGVSAAAATEIADLLTLSADVWVDRFSARERAIDPKALPRGSRTVRADEIANQLLDPDVRVVWH